MKYFFIHIGKTGGASFAEIVKQNANTLEFHHSILNHISSSPLTKDNGEPFEESEVKRIERLLSENDGFTGHMTHGLHEYTAEPYKYLSILRHPVDRMVSQYNYNMQHHKGKMVAYCKDFRDFVKKSKRDRRIGILRLSGLPTKLNSLMWRGSQYDETYDLDEHIELALVNLMQEDILFGFTDKYDEYLNLLRKELDWTINPVKKNVTKFKADISEEDILFATELCEREIEFHNKAIEIYNKRWQTS